MFNKYKNYTNFAENKNNKAFTLIELLVVISIIGLLSSIVLVSTKGVREKARLAKAQKFDSSIQHALGSEAVGIWRFEEGSGTTAHDESGYGNDGELKNFANPPTATSGWAIGDGVYPNTNAMRFDGNDYINCGNTADGDYNALTISTWIKPTSFTPNRWRTALHRNDDTSVGSSVFFIATRSGSNQIVSTIGAGSGAVGGYMAGATGITAQIDTWYYVVNSWDGTTAKVYVNGIEEKIYSLSSTNFSNKTAITRIGASGDGTGYLFNGLIDDVRIYDTALSAMEIQQHYAEGTKKYGVAEK